MANAALTLNRKTFPIVSNPMHLKKVTLNNFRCFEHLEVPLHPRLTVLVAENGGGKTSILDAIAIGLSPVMRYLSSAEQRLEGPGIKDADFRLMSEPSPRTKSEPNFLDKLGVSPPLSNQDSKSGRVVKGDYAQVVIETVDGMVWDNWRPVSQGKQPDTKYGQSKVSGYCSSILQSFTAEPKLFPVFAYYGAKRGWITVPERLRASKVDYSSPSSALLGALESLSDFAEMLKWFDLASASESRAKDEKDPKDFKPSPELEAIRNTLKSLLGGDYHSPRFNHQHKFVVQSRTGPQDLQVIQLSQGYQSMLALGMDFARRLALANGHLTVNSSEPNWEAALKNTKDMTPAEIKSLPERGPLWAPAVMLVDEIDLHLHPSWQNRVLGDLMKAFPGTQFIVTSHSPQILSTVPQESIVILKGGKIHSSPPGTDGAEVQRILEDVFGVPRRPITPMSEMLDDYLRLVNLRQWDSDRALELRRNLEEWSAGQEPSLLDADLQIENLKWEAGQ